mgnify:FL=1
MKFGIGRATSDTAHEIRDGKITREEGIALVKKYDEEFPSLYLKEILDFLSLTESEYMKIIENWRNKDLWVFKSNKWVLKNPIWGATE